MLSNQNHSLEALNTDHKSEVKMPAGIFYIIGNELAERFGIGGISVILMVFMTQYLVNSQGDYEFTGPQAMVWYHNFFAAMSFCSFVGAIIADVLWGKYKTIVIFSIIYCFGHIVLVFSGNKTCLFYGLALVAIGCGGILPCVASHLGDQFGKKDRQQINKAYSLFYLAIIIGTFTAMLLIPYLLERYGPKIAFAVPGFLMLIAVIIFYQGRNVFLRIPPIGLQKYAKELGDQDNLKAIGNLSVIFAFAIVLHSLREQSGSSWVIQAGQMNREINLGFIKFSLIQSQIQASEYGFLAVFIMLFPYVIYPFFGKFTKVTHLKKIGAGFFVAAASFAIIAYAQNMIEQGKNVSVMWQILAYAFLSIEEILVLTTCIELSYTHSPRSMKSLALALSFLSMGMGNILTAIVNHFCQDAHGSLIIALSTYFWCFSFAMILVGILFIIYMPHYKGRVYLQKMKTSIPERSIEHHLKIKQINDVILKVFKNKAAFIIFFSPIVHRGQQGNGNIKESSDNVGDYNFLIVTKFKKNAKPKFRAELEDQIRKKLVSRGIEPEMSKDNKITITIESINKFNLRSERQRLLKEGILLYGANRLRLSEPKKMTRDRRKEMAQKGYKHWYKKGLNFLKIYETMKNKIDDNGLLALQLHQATESFYNCSLMVLTGEKPHSHELTRLNYLLCDESNIFANIFPISSREEAECFKLLEDGYIASRYEFDFLITNQQLEYLFDKIEELKEITKEVCEEEIRILEMEKTQFSPPSRANHEMATTNLFSTIDE
jgi:POT family proton-dependent oligopeptide transporter